MNVATAESLILGRPSSLPIYGSKPCGFLHCNRVSKVLIKVSLSNSQYPSCISLNSSHNYALRPHFNPKLCATRVSTAVKGHSNSLGHSSPGPGIEQNATKGELMGMLLIRGVVLGAMVCEVLVFGCKTVFVAEGVVNAGYGVDGQFILLLRGAWLKILQLLKVFKEQGPVLVALLGLSAFFPTPETSIRKIYIASGVPSQYLI